MNLIMTYCEVEYSLIEAKYGINFSNYFAREIKALNEFVQLDIIEVTERNIAVKNPGYGYHFLPNLCMIFDNLGRDYKHNIETGVKKRRFIQTGNSIEGLVR